MFKQIIKLTILLCVVCLVIPYNSAVGQEVGEKERVDKTITNELDKPTSNFDRGIGFLDAGKLYVGGIENYALLGYRGYPNIKHGAWGELRWFVPVLGVPPQPWATNVVREEGIVEDRSEFYNCIESMTQRFCQGGMGVSSTDWEAVDYAKDQLMGTETWSSIPLIATSNGE